MLEDGGGSLDTGITVADRNWHHVVVVIKANTLPQLWLDGRLSFDYTGGAMPTAPVGQTTIGCRAYAGTKYPSFIGLIDEVAIWTRILSNTEITQLYRRGANRVRYEVRTCTDPTCSANPDWLGPANSEQAFFSELYNTTGNSSGAAVLATSPAITFANFGASPSANRYFQYRMQLESDDMSTSCAYGGSSTQCSPEVTQVSTTPGSYATTSPTITNVTGVPFVSLSSFTEALGAKGCADVARYQLSIDNTNFYYVNDTNWTLGTSYAQASIAAVVAANVSTFATQVGTGSVHVRAFLPSDGSTPCEIDQLAIAGTQ